MSNLTKKSLPEVCIVDIFKNLTFCKVLHSLISLFRVLSIYSPQLENWMFKTCLLKVWKYGAKKKILITKVQNCSVKVHVLWEGRKNMTKYPSWFVVYWSFLLSKKQIVSMWFRQIFVAFSQHNTYKVIRYTESQDFIDLGSIDI